MDASLTPKSDRTGASRSLPSATFLSRQSVKLNITTLLTLIALAGDFPCGSMFCWFPGQGGVNFDFGRTNGLNIKFSRVKMCALETNWLYMYVVLLL